MVKCNCKWKNCKRHGKCHECREHHKNHKKYPLPFCENIKVKKEKLSETIYIDEREK